jgi:hypothetical protein
MNFQRFLQFLQFLRPPARDAAVATFLPLQHGCSVDTLRKALTRHSDGSGSWPLAHALDLLVEGR